MKRTVWGTREIIRCGVSVLAGFCWAFVFIEIADPCSALPAKKRSFGEIPWSVRWCWRKRIPSR